MPTPRVIRVNTSAVLYALTAGSVLKRMRFGRYKAPVCPSAKSGKPLPISFLQSGNIRSASD